MKLGNTHITLLSLSRVYQHFHLTSASLDKLLHLVSRLSHTVYVFKTTLKTPFGWLWKVYSLNLIACQSIDITYILFFCFNAHNQSSLLKHSPSSPSLISPCFDKYPSSSRALDQDWLDFIRRSPLARGQCPALHLDDCCALHGDQASAEGAGFV